MSKRMAAPLATIEGLAALAEEAFLKTLARLEKANGGPYKPRNGKLPTGRPLR